MQGGSVAVRSMKRFAGIGALVMSFGLVTLEVRQLFAGPFLNIGEFTHAEWYAYSAAWILFAALLLVIGICTKGKVIRWASLSVMMVAVIKVFLLDSGHLEGFWRVASYFGLGVSLLALAYVYQRYVFAQISDVDSTQQVESRTKTSEDSQASD